jgi:hypothetical protein
MQLGIGEALVSTLDEKGQPTVVEKTWVKPPSSRVGPISEAERKSVVGSDPVRDEYDEAEDRESAFEMLQARTAKRVEAEEETRADQAEEKAAKKKAGGASRSDGFWTTLGKSIVRSGVPMATRVLESAIKRGALGGIRRGGSGGIGFP